MLYFKILKANMPKITNLDFALPAYQHAQEDIASYMLHNLRMDERGSKLLKLAYARSGIHSRYSVLSEFSGKENPSFFVPDAAVGMSSRMKKYDENALNLSLSSIQKVLPENERNEVSHLITVSCTGMSAPGLDLQILRALNLPIHIHRTSVNFMGCYAAIHALKLAHAFCKAEKDAKVLIVCTELCTLHFQHTTKDEDILSACLFADGSAACIVSNEPGEGLEILGFQSRVALEGYNDMAWEISDHGFLMNLSTYVPKLVEKDMGNLVNACMEHYQKDIHHWAIHPGGKNILEAVQKSVGLKNKDLEASYEVLKNYGNMSSPTVLFVLKELMKKMQKGDNTFMAAFGPGLTLESAVLSST